MKSKLKRLAEFVQYHKTGDGECNNVVLKEYANEAGLTEAEKFALVYYFSITYCVPAAIYMTQEDEKIKSDPGKWAKENKGKIVFQSDRKYVKMQDHFENLLTQYVQKKDYMENGIKAKIKDGKLDLKTAIPFVESWYFFGRFSAFLFLETWAEMNGVEVWNATIDWPNGDTATSGLLNLYAYDVAATLFDKTGELLVPKEKMDVMLMKLLVAIEKSGGDSNVTKVETSLCAYRKFYKGTRYNGYYLDRMLDEIVFYEDKYPEMRTITEKIKAIRKKNYNAKYLGEIMGWNGVRRECKKIYKETGRII